MGNQQYRAYLVNLHPYVFWTTKYTFSVGHSLFLWPRQLCWAWWQCTHLELPFPSWKISRHSLSAWGAWFLKSTPWMHLWMPLVYFLVTISLRAEQPFLSLSLFFEGAIQGTQGLCPFRQKFDAEPSKALPKH